MQTLTKKMMRVLALSALLLFCSLQVGAAVLSPGHPPRITVEDVRNMLDAGETVLFIDTRTHQQWQNAAHKIPGAVRLVTTSDMLDLTRDYPADTIIVTYCT